MTSSVSKSSKLRPQWGGFAGLSVMDRYIVSELLAPFLFGVGMFSSLGVSIDALFYLINRVVESGLSPAIAVEVLLLKFPQFIAYSFPMSVLLATLMTFSRLSTDSELTALKACGVSVYRMIVPAIALCFVVTGLTFAFNELIVPAANYRASTTLERALNQDEPNFQERNILYQEFQDVRLPNGDEEEVLSRLFYAREFDGKQMRGLTILDFSQEGLNQIVSSKAATWNIDESTWDFYDGTIYVVSADGSFRNIVRFDQQQLKLPRAPLDLASRGRDYGEMNIAQSLDYLDLIRNSGNDRKILELRVRIHQKFALPFICIAFGLAGAALGAGLRGTGRATSFAVSIVIIFGYYLTAFVSGAIAQIGAIPPFVGAWIPNFLGLAAGTFFLVRASR